MDIEAIRKKRKEQERQRATALDAVRQTQNSESIRSAVEDNMAMGAKSTARVATAVKESTNTLSEQLKNNSKTIIDSLSSQNNAVSDALNNLVVATVLARDPQLVEVINDFTSLLDNLSAATANLKNNPLNDLPTVNKQLVKALQDFTKQDSKEPDYTAKFDALESTIKNLDLKPVVNIPKSDTKLNLEPLVSAINDVQSAVKANKVKLPDINFDAVVFGLEAVQNTIANLSFPVPNYVLPFKDSTGKATQALVDSSGSISTNSGSIITSSYDYMAATYPDGVTEVYTYKLGGSGGTTVATVTMVYTDSTKATISTISKT